MITTPKTFAEAVRRVSELAQAKMPDALHGHIQRATAIVLHGGVWLDDEGRHAQVLGSDGTTWYRVNGHCTCMDAPKAPEGYCKHKLAVMLYRRAGDLLRSAPLPLGEGEASQPAPPCPEALFSATFDGRIGGVGVRLTARGATFETFAANVQAVRALLDAPVEPQSATSGSAPSSPAQQTPTCAVHGPMPESKKAPGTYFCPKKLWDGSFCKSRFPER